MNRNQALPFHKAITAAEHIYATSNRNLSGYAANTLPNTWKPHGKLWISPYLGSAMTLEMALKLEATLQIWRCTPRNP